MSKHGDRDFEQLANPPRTLEEILAEDTVAAIQCQPFVEIDPETPTHEAVRTLAELKVASLLVVKKGELIGIFTERDVLEKVTEQYDHVQDRPVSEFMTMNTIVVYEDDPAAAALSAIAAGGYRHVPVLALDGSVVGIVSPRRVFSFLKRHLG